MEGVGTEITEIIQVLSTVGHTDLNGKQDQIVGIRKMDVRIVQLWKTEKLVVRFFQVS